MSFLLIFQIIISILLIVAVLLQSQGGGLGSAFGGSATYHTKRGVEKGIFYFTIILAILFTASSVANLL